MRATFTAYSDKCITDLTIGIHNDISVLKLPPLLMPFQSYFTAEMCSFLHISTANKAKVTNTWQQIILNVAEWLFDHKYKCFRIILKVLLERMTML